MKLYVKIYLMISFLEMFPLHCMEREDKSYTSYDNHEKKARLAAGDDVNAREMSELTLLHLAALRGEVAAVKTLLNANEINVNVPNTDGWTPLHIAALNGHELVVKVLLDAPGIDAHAQDKHGGTPLHWAAGYGQEAVVKVLLDAPGIDAHAQDKHGGTPLHWAAGYGQEAVVKVLLDAPGIDAHAQDKHGGTPLHYAAWHGQEAAVKTLLNANEINVNTLDGDGLTPLHWAAGNGQEAVVKTLVSLPGINVNVPNKGGWTPLHIAALNGHELVVKILLNATGTNVNIPNKHEIVSLCCAVIVDALSRAKDININAQTLHGLTPLYTAAINGHDDIVKALLSVGAYVNGVMIKGFLRSGTAVHRWTPLHIAVYLGHEAVVKILLKTADINVNAVSQEGLTPLDVAMQNDDLNVSIIREVLLYGGKLLNDENRIKLHKLFKNNPLLGAVILNNYTEVREYVLRSNRETIGQALWYAVGQGNIEIVQCMLSLIDDELPFSEMIDHVNALLKNSLTPEQEMKYKQIIKLLERAARRTEVCSICTETYHDSSQRKTHTLDCFHKFHADCIKPWLEMKNPCPSCRILPETIDSQALDAKLLATIAKKGTCKEIEELLKLGADSNHERQGMTPLMLAVLSGQDDSVHLLLEYMSINPINKLQECLCWAAENKFLDIMCLLIEAGAIVDPKVDPKNEGVVNAMWSALKKEFVILAALGNAAAVKVMLGHGELNVLKRALLYALAQGHVEIVECIVKELIKRHKFDANEFLGIANNIFQRCRNTEYVERYEKIIEIIRNGGSLLSRGISIYSLPAPGFNS